MIILMQYLHRKPTIGLAVCRTTTMMMTVRGGNNDDINNHKVCGDGAPIGYVLPLLVCY